MTRTDRTWLADAVAKSDWIRRPPSRLGGPHGFKEWLHFCIYGDRFDLLVNFSEVDGAKGEAPIARQTILARRRGWIGGIERAANPRLVAGGIFAELDDSKLEFIDGAFQMRVRSKTSPISADLRLVPIAAPAPIYNVSVGDGPPIHWVVVPRLLASGEVSIEGEKMRVRDLPAYHDHNWGFFRWGRDFAWEWGFGLPRDTASPWSLVFARLSNRALNRTRMQTAFIWHRSDAVAAFRDHQIEIRHRGLMRPERVFKVPPVMGLISSGAATDIPERMEIDCKSEMASLEACFEPKDVVQVIIPNDDDLGVTIINEVAGELSAHVRVGDEEGEIRCRTIFEFLGR